MEDNKQIINIIKTKIKENKKIENKELDIFFKCVNLQDKKNLKIKRKELKEMYYELKEELNDIYPCNEKNYNILVQTFRYADVLRHKNLNNYCLLEKFSNNSIENPNEDKAKIYFIYKNYCNNYNSLANLMARKILDRNNNLDLLDYEIYIEEAVDNLNEKHSKLLNYIKQTVKIDNGKNKKR